MPINEKPSKEEYAVASWIRSNVPSKKTKFDRNHIVEYFTGTRAVDALLENSPWSQTRFKTRQQVVDFLELMLTHKFFHRAKKIVITEDELTRLKGGKKKLKEGSKEEKKSSGTDKEKDKKSEKEEEQKEKEQEKKVDLKKKPKVS